jgi:NodT family efflux transporter outer membrane factor (OMF) lipoprotein
MKPPRQIWFLAALAACNVGPDYERPPVAAPAAFKEQGGWQPASPRDELKRGPWWEMFGDPQLTELAQQVADANLDVAVAAARFRSARALVHEARAGWMPTVTAGASATRSRTGSSRGGTGSAEVSNYQLSLDATWEADLWGRVSRTVEASAAGAQASAADLESVRLSAQAALVGAYFLLRVADAQRQLFADTIAAYERNLRMVQNRQAQGVASPGEVVQAQAQLEGARAQSIDLGVQRAQLEHAIAVLIGKAPAEVSIAPAPLPTVVPVVPPGLPSQLLERRPDVATAERLMAAANARIGVAAAAFYPTLSISGAAGFRSTDLSDWITAPSRFWSIGPALAETLFDGGARSAVSEQAQADYDAAVASYRATVLTAFADVEDQIATLRILEQEAQVQDAAVRAARQSVAIAENQYRAGTASYLDVIIVQTVLLNDERAAVAILGRRLVAAAALVKALGGGWTAGELPAARDL